MGDSAESRSPRIVNPELLLNAGQELCWSDFERAGDPNNIDQTHVSLSTLDSANICPVQVSPFGQGLLRKPQRMPPLPDGLAELNPRIRVHALIFREQIRCF